MTHAVGIHVSQGPETCKTRSNGRVNLSVHLRISGFEAVLALFYTVLALFGTVWHCISLGTPFGTLRMSYI